MNIIAFNTEINIFLILLFVWGLPLTLYRSRFRKMVYETDSWWINVTPRFVKETRALLCTIYPDNTAYLRLRNFYRFYLLVYILLWIFYLLTK